MMQLVKFVRYFSLIQLGDDDLLEDYYNAPENKSDKAIKFLAFAISLYGGQLIQYNIQFEVKVILQSVVHIMDK
jgi:uncharacterized membrane protein YiaA